jgi:hypothetical protein
VIACVLLTYHDGAPGIKQPWNPEPRHNSQPRKHPPVPPQPSKHLSYSKGTVAVFACDAFPCRYRPALECQHPRTPKYTHHGNNGKINNMENICIIQTLLKVECIRLSDFIVSRWACQLSTAGLDRPNYEPKSIYEGHVVVSDII